jgi:hypothetical protein
VPKVPRGINSISGVDFTFSFLLNVSLIFPYQLFRSSWDFSRFIAFSALFDQHLAIDLLLLQKVVGSQSNDRKLLFG